MKVAGAALLALPLLAGCGAQASPPADPGPSTTTPVSPAASPSPQPGPTSATPTSDPRRDVDSAARAFWAQAGRVGYPETSFDQYTKRVTPLMASHGFEEFIRPENRAQFAKEATIFYRERRRVVPRVEGDVAVSGATGDKAVAKLRFGTTTQERRDGRWRTTASRPHQTSTLTFVRTNGHWLVDDATS